MATIASVMRGLSSLMENVKKPAMSRAVLAVEAAAKREAPVGAVRGGTLRRSITGRVERGGNAGRVGTNLKYARPVHDGSKAHVIRAKAKKALFWKGAAHPVKSVKMPARAGNPFFVRAVDVARPTVERELAAVGIKALVKIT